MVMYARDVRSRSEADPFYRAQTAHEGRLKLKHHVAQRSPAGDCPRSCMFLPCQITDTSMASLRSLRCCTPGQCTASTPAPEVCKMRLVGNCHSPAVALLRGHFAMNRRCNKVYRSKNDNDTVHIDMNAAPSAAIADRASRQCATCQKRNCICRLPESNGLRKVASGSGPVGSTIRDSVAGVSCLQLRWQAGVICKSVSAGCVWADMV
jgi:hypothetical protein